MATLKRDKKGLPVVKTYILPDEKLVTHVGSGQSDYDPKNRAGGVIMPQFSVKGFLQVFGIYSTNVFFSEE